MRVLADFGADWLFEGRETVRLPHNAVELPFSYFDERDYQREFTYTKAFTADPAWGDDEVSVVFEGAMANARVSLNGEELAAHAEMLAITAATNALGSKYLTDCAIYVTIEPCMMCATALFWSKIGAVYYAAGDNRYGFTHFDNQLFNQATHVEKGLLEHDCGQLMKDFFKKKRELDKL